VTTLHVLDLHTTVKDTDSHHRQEVVGGVRVVVYTAKECGCGVGSNGLLDQVSTTGVVGSETGAIVDKAVNRNKRSLLCLSLEVVPRNDREVVGAFWPLELFRLCVEFLQLHRVLTLLDFVVRETLEVGSETERRHGANEPLGRVVLVPLDGVSEIHWELVVEVVVTFANSDERGEKVISRSVLVVERLVTEPVGERVDAESGVVNKDQSSSTREEESTSPITPHQSCDGGGEDHAHSDQEHEVVLVLPSDDLVLGQIRDVGDTDLASRLDNHPSDVCPPETLVSRVGVELGVGVSVVCSVTSRPPLDGTLDCAGASHGEGVLKGCRSIVRSVGPKSMVAGGDTKTSDEVVDYTPNKSLLVERGGEHAVDGEGGSDGDGEE